MKVVFTKTTASEILFKLQNGEFADWDILYDQYSAIVYGAILQLTTNKKIANQILLDTFVAIKTTTFTGTSLIMTLIKCAQTTAKNHLDATQAVIKSMNKTTVQYPDYRLADPFPLQFYAE